jgi:putative acetyltransferase
LCGKGFCQKGMCYHFTKKIPAKNMITIRRTNSGDYDFQQLEKELDADLRIRDGEDHSFYAQFNKSHAIKYVVVAYESDCAVGCGAIKEYAPGVMEVKRMYVPPGQRRKGIASIVLKELEIWCAELNCRKCILETGKQQPEAIEAYKRNGYIIMPNYGQYEGVENSVCFVKELAL